jgi:hypothetical protein
MISVSLPLFLFPSPTRLFLPVTLPPHFLSLARARSLSLSRSRSLSPSRFYLRTLDHTGIQWAVDFGGFGKVV